MNVVSGESSTKGICQNSLVWSSIENTVEPTSLGVISSSTGREQCECQRA